MNRLLLFLAEGFEEIEAAAFIDVFGWSRVVEGVTPVETVVAGLREEIHATHSLVVKPQNQLEEVDLSTIDAVAVPGGFHDRGFTEAYDPKFLNALKTVHANGGYIASICVGARPVAEAGLLENRNAVTYPLDSNKHIEFLRGKGAVICKDEIVVHDRIITSTGPGTALGVALKLFELMNGQEEVKLLKRDMRILD